MTTTVRTLLSKNDFDPQTGVILYQEVDEGSRWPGWATPVAAAIIPWTSDMLDKPFDDSYGGPECPRIVAKDKNAVYFPYQYDGATGIDKVYLDINLYLDFKRYKTPYPGG